MLLFTPWLSEVLPFSTKSVVVMMVKMLCWKLSHRSVSLLRSYKLKFPAPVETTLLPQSASISPTADIFLHFRPTFLNWTHGTDNTTGFLGLSHGHLS